MSKSEVTAHLKKFAPEQRRVLQALREEIGDALPNSQEVIKYGIPTFTVDGIAVIGFDGYKTHNSIFPYSGSIADQLGDALGKYERTKGSIHFDREKTFPKTLLRRIIKARQKQIAERGK
jgi:uncharacterized protein YdhG (YjbR/CyaY superfamily)